MTNYSEILNFYSLGFNKAQIAEINGFKYPHDNGMLGTKTLQLSV